MTQANSPSPHHGLHPNNSINTRNHAIELAEKWRRRYEHEAQQRRSELLKAEQTIQQLRAEVQQLCQLGPAAAPRLDNPVAQEDNNLTRLKLEMQRLRQENAELSQALDQEKARHQQTKENLMLALGDALKQRPPRSPES